LLLLRKFMVWL